MPGEAGNYLYAAINQTWFVFAKAMKGVIQKVIATDRREPSRAFRWR
jgi:hypothetical protein